MPEGRKIAVTGASGLVGRALVAALGNHGFEVLRMVRRTPSADDEVQWDPEAGTIDVKGLVGVTGAVHLAGDNVTSGRWTEGKKAKIRDSRVRGTELLAGALARLSPRPEVMVSASATGYYGARGAEMLDEGSTSGDGFLASVCREWEGATGAARDAGIRVVNARIGEGSQYMSWITLADLVSALIFALEHRELEGPVNMVSPTPVTNADFTSTLGRVLRRPTIVPVPKFAVRLGAGTEMANELLIGGARVIPAALHARGFQWQHATLEPALRSVS
jgi:NAD dependent epimerase/dehydratase family enzyme